MNIQIAEKTNAPKIKEINKYFLDNFFIPKDRNFNLRLFKY
jgi:hypothetical protein